MASRSRTERPIVSRRIIGGVHPGHIAPSCAVIVLAMLCVSTACSTNKLAPANNGVASVPPTKSGAAGSPTMNANAGAGSDSSSTNTGVAGSTAITSAGSAAAGSAAAGQSAAGSSPADDEDAGLQTGDGGAGSSGADSGAAGSPANDARNCTPNAYVSNSSSDSVSVIDTGTNKVVATISVGKAPVNPTFTLDGRQVYVSNSQAGTLSVIDVATNTVTSTIPAGGPSPSGLAFTPDAKKLVVTLLGNPITAAGSVAVITLATGDISKPIPLGADPERLVLLPSADRAYIDNLVDGTMSVVDLTANKVITTIMMGSLPFNILMSPSGDKLYAGVISSNVIAVIDTKTNMIVNKIASDSPNGMTFSLDFQRIFVTNVFAGTAQEISLQTNMVVKTGMIGGIPGFMDLSQDGKHAYFVRPAGTTLDVLDTSTLSVVDSITVGSAPDNVAICHKPPKPSSVQ